ncbi:DUF2163 domain-containing protein [Paracoccus sp. 1_MG-2023]|uniref:DUF2163 domain-containing protein n=1 Tax=unclassified Paracoccus (in: a-proteobacteria) TaxID=2688777 RepID=UPI001C0A25BC|nr:MULTISPECIES: DUF2163 domain-containing protein [unclassified Paracoccus (in: a-proteobacteria)]MBU2958638.1 DUF2163 domain-containing protein [Paracoccus sp. C2R09]MDO6667631.1 DUF2163 domain-containing protein [Paracoccus sp. 1_MG-2023]
MSTTIARAWCVTRADGLQLGFTDHDCELSFDGIVFKPDHGLDASALLQATGLSVDNAEATGALSDDAITERDLMAGRWDAATIRMWEVDWIDPEDRKLMFRGSLGEVSHGNGSFRAELRGLTDRLNAPQGRVFHPRCSAMLGDTACGVDTRREGLSVELTVDRIEEGRILRFDSFASYDADWFEHGRIVVLSGEAEGLQGRVKNDRVPEAGGRIVELWAGLNIIPAPGDRIRIEAGCDKASSTCRLKFANFLNFRGFPHLPSEDWLMAPQTGGRNV